MPRWVMVFVVLGIVLAIVAIAALAFGGEHGPGRHRRASESGAEEAPDPSSGSPAPSPIVRPLLWGSAASGSGAP